MKKFFNFMTLAALMLTMTACPPEPEKIPESFPKKQLIEHYTGQACGYCPGGMDAIQAFIDESGYDVIWISNHAGYADDEYTLDESKTLASKMGVTGAPSITLNRQAVKYQGGSATASKPAFHPGYLESLTTKLAETTYASVNIEPTLADGKLTVKVKGIVCDSSVTDLKLTVVVTESGLHGTQADYKGTFEGWQDFIHSHTIRAYLTEALGELVAVTANKYAAEVSCDFDSEWDADNCSVVAFLTETTNKPVVQAEEVPVVVGTKGANGIKHGGVTVVPVDPTYPETAGLTPAACLAGATIHGASAGAYYESYPSYGFNLWGIQIQGSDTKKISGTNAVSFADVQFFTATNVTALAPGSYPLGDTYEPGTGFAGYRDDEAFAIGGSMAYMVSSSYLQQGYLAPVAQWLLTDGTLVITENSIELTSTTLSGDPIHIVFEGEIQNYGKQNMPKRSASPARNLFREFVDAPFVPSNVLFELAK